MNQNSLAPPGRSRDRASPCGPQGKLLGLCLDVWSTSWSAEAQWAPVLQMGGGLGRRRALSGLVYTPGWSPARPFIFPVASVNPLDASPFSRLQQGVTRASWAALEIPVKMKEWARKLAALCCVHVLRNHQTSNSQSTKELWS